MSLLVGILKVVAERLLRHWRSPSTLRTLTRAGLLLFATLGLERSRGRKRTAGAETCSHQRRRPSARRRPDPDTGSGTWGPSQLDEFAYDASNHLLRHSIFGYPGGVKTLGVEFADTYDSNSPRRLDYNVATFWDGSQARNQVVWTSQGSSYTDEGTWNAEPVQDWVAAYDSLGEWNRYAW